MERQSLWLDFPSTHLNVISELHFVGEVAPVTRETANTTSHSVSRPNMELKVLLPLVLLVAERAHQRLQHNKPTNLKTALHQGSRGIIILFPYILNAQIYGELFRHQ